MCDRLTGPLLLDLLDLLPTVASTPFPPTVSRNHTQGLGELVSDVDVF